MKTKTITISLEAYKKLIANKTSSKESFTDVILTLTKNRDTLAYIRSLKPSTELADNIEKAMKETRTSPIR
ncbi:MAG: antitoxin [Spirochaetes bacterium]|nr:antitoxin [Spirochaetota bacterium]